MPTRKFRFHDGKSGASLAVRVTPRANKNEIVDILDDGTIRVRLATQPDSNDTNRALVEFIALVLEVSLLAAPNGDAET